MVNDMWKDPAFMELSPAEKLLYNYLLNSPVNNGAGYYRLTKAQLRMDFCREADTPSGLNEFDEKVFNRFIYPALVSNKLWRYDEQAKQVLVPNYLKYNKVGSQTQVKGVLFRAVDPLERCPLHILFLKECYIYLGEGHLKYLWSLFDEKTKAYVRTECRSQSGDGMLLAAKALITECLIS